MSLRAYAVAYLIFLYAPIFLLPLFAFNDSTIIAFPLSGFTTGWFTELTETPALHAAVKNSLFIAILTAIFSTLLGICAARAGAKYEFPAKRGILGLIMVPLVLPEIIVGVSLLVVVVNLLDWSLSSWTVIAAHVLICTPFSIAILNGAFQNMDASLEEAALDLGETPWSTFRLVTLPLVMPGIISSLLISFTISLDEFIIAFFLTGAEPTMPVYIWGLLRFPQKLPAVMALGTILVVASIIILTIAELMRRRGLKRAGLKDTGGFL
ncbi:ABC transporter permease [Shimia ponticola]|uniref:ABC transporter permease n=1 Tax=Shimia ponticola TaxID=2582893 RepID=UPI0011BDA395|nr:ABC transporter permease [Shimia ponticola]